MSLSRPSAEKHEKNEKDPSGRQSPDWNRPNMSDLRIVLLGKSLYKNIRVRNLILRTCIKEMKLPSDYLMNSSVRISGMVENRKISMISCSPLLQQNLSHHQIREGVRECVSKSDPGPHVFILVLQHLDFSEKDKYRVMDVLNCFSDQAMKRTLVVTTDEEDIHRSVRNNELKKLINVCGGGHLYFNERQPGWRSEMLRRVDDILEKEPEEYLKCDIYEDTEKSYVDPKVTKHEDKKNKDGGGLFSSVSGKSNLNLVLCGADPGLKVNISKLLRGKPPSNKKEFSPQCVKKEETIHGHQISVVELPSLTQLSEDEAMHQSLNCVSLCDPGVHVFLIIIPVGSLTDKDKAEVEKIQMMFYSSENFIVIFTSDLTVDRRVTDSLESYPECQNLISDCGGRYRVIGLKEHEKSKQIPELLDYIKDMKTELYSLQMYVRAQEMRVRDEYEEKLSEMKSKIKELQLKINPCGIEDEQEDLKHLRIVLIGKMGNGKSATGNTILGLNEFLSQSSTDSVTTVCEKRVCEVDGRSVAVVDTTGLFDTKTQKEQVLKQIMKCVLLSAPGPHAFILVLSLRRFTKEETNTMDQMKKIFGPEVAQFSIILFTRGDDLKGESIEDYVRESESAELQKLIRDCGNRYLAFNNNETQDRTQVTKLIKMIEEMKTKNHSRYFTNSMFEEAEISIQKRMEEILKEKKIQNQKEELKVKHEIEIENMKKRLEEEKRKADEERMKMENKFKEQEKTLRKEFEEKEKTERQKREKEKQKRLEEEKQQRAEYHQKIEEMKREIEQQISQYEKREKEREEEDRKREEKYRKDQDKMKAKEDLIIQLQKKQDEEIKKRDLDEQKRSEQEEREKQEWARKIKEAENGIKETREEIKRQRREWEEDKKRQMREREEDDRKRRERHEEQLREKQELEKTRKKFERERDEERRQREDERQKQRQEREEKEREYEEKENEMMNHYEKLDQEIKEEWERKKREDDEKREEERKRWEKRIEDIKKYFF